MIKLNLQFFASAPARNYLAINFDNGITKVETSDGKCVWNTSGRDVETSYGTGDTPTVEFIVTLKENQVINTIESQLNSGAFKSKTDTGFILYDSIGGIGGTITLTSAVGLTPKEQFISDMNNLANSIKAKSGVTENMTIKEMKNAVDGITQPSGTLEITANGNYNVIKYANVKVNLFISANEDINMMNISWQKLIPVTLNSSLSADGGSGYAKVVNAETNEMLLNGGEIGDTAGAWENFSDSNEIAVGTTLESVIFVTAILNNIKTTGSITITKVDSTTEILDFNNGATYSIQNDDKKIEIQLSGIAGIGAGAGDITGDITIE